LPDWPDLAICTSGNLSEGLVGTHRTVFIYCISDFGAVSSTNMKLPNQPLQAPSSGQPVCMGLPCMVSLSSGR